MVDLFAKLGVAGIEGLLHKAVRSGDFDRLEEVARMASERISARTGDKELAIQARVIVEKAANARAQVAPARKRDANQSLASLILVNESIRNRVED